MTKLASPYATGGGGSDFESWVGTYYLACALTRSIARGLPDAITREVSFQALNQGEPLDDIVVRGERLDHEAKLSLQVKRDLVFGAQDAMFVDVMRRCWLTFDGPRFRHGVDRFGIALGLYSKTIDEHYQTVLAWARSETSGERFVQRIETAGLASRKQREFLDLIGSQLALHSGRVSSPDELWRFCRSFIILHFDFQTEGSRDAAHLVAQMQLATAADSASAAVDVLREIESRVDVARRTGGTESTETLREALSGRFSIRASPDIRRDLNALQQHAALILSNIELDINGMSLPRSAALDDLTAAVARHNLIGVVGAPGTGKSAILRMLLEIQAANGQYLMFSGDRLEGQGLDSFVNTIGGHGSLKEILLSAGASAIPLVALDGLDRCITRGARQIANDLLRLIWDINARRVHPWRVVFTARDQNLQSVLQWAAFSGGATPEIVTVAALSDAEASVMADRLPSLSPLLGQTHLRPVTRNLFMVRRLTDPCIRENLPDQATITEVDLATVWWEHVVGDTTAAGITRQQVLLRLAGSFFESDNSAVLSLSAEAVSSLRDDRILSTEPHRDVARFAHDIFEDWTLLRLVDLHRDDLGSYLRTVGETYRLQRAVRLFACSLLEHGQVALWQRMLAMLEDDQTLAPRWRHAFLSSPLLSVRACDLLEGIKVVLFDGDGRRLAELLTAARTVDVSPDFSNFPGLALVASASDELQSLLLHRPVPHWPVWKPLIGWLIERAGDIPAAARPHVIRVFELWQVHTDPAEQRVPRGAIYRGEIADIALSWLGGHAEVPAGSREKDIADHGDRLRRIILRSADVRPDQTSKVLQWIAGGWNESAIQQMLMEVRNAAAFIADRYVDAALTLLQPRDRNIEDGWSARGVLNDYGFRHDHDFYPPSHGQGPFIWLFRENESEALRLVHSLANMAIDRWRDSQTDRRDYVGTPVPLTLRFPWDDQQFWGGLTEYMWFRADADGPKCVVSALMALEFWMEEQLQAGRDAEELFATVLKESRCIAVPALCLGITLAEPEKCLRAALPIVCSPRIWLFDVRRKVSDQLPSLNYDPLGQHETMTLLRSDRDKRPQRKLDVQTLAPAYLFGEDETLRDAFMRAVHTFTAEIPVFYEEQQTDAQALEQVRRELEMYQALAVHENWRHAKEGDVTYLICEPPQNITEERTGTIQRIAEESTWLRLNLWSQKTLEKCDLDDSLSLDEAIKECQRLYSADLFASPMQFSDGLETFRQQAVAGGTAALVAVASDWVRDNGHRDWCRGILREAAAMPHGDVEESARRVAIPSHPRVSAIRGLAALVRDGVATQAERESLLKLCMEWNSEFLSALSRTLADIWNADPQLGWAIFSLSVDRMTLLSSRPTDQDEAKRNAALLNKHVDALRRDERIPLVSIAGRDDHLDCYLFQDACFGLPIELVAKDTWARPQLLQLFRELGRWTLGRNRAKRTSYVHALYEWNAFFARTLARLAGALDDSEYKDVVLTFLKDSWHEPLDILPDYLGGYLGWQLASVETLPPIAIKRWNELARWLLASERLARYSSKRYTDRATSEAIAWLVFTTTLGENYFKTIWPHAAVFTDTVDAFVSVLGTDPRAFRRLLVFLSRFFERFPSATVLRWLCANGSRPPSGEFYSHSDVGLRTAQVLQDLWRERSEQILDRGELQRRYSLLVDELLAAGVPLAKILADRLAEQA